MNTRNKDTRTRNIHIKIDPELLKAAKMRCIEEETNLSDSVRDLLTAWVESSPIKGLRKGPKGT
jgi:hypothetical protein